MAAERRLLEKILYGLRHPGRLAAHARRRWRNALLRRRARDPVDFYRRVVDDNARGDPDRAVGSDSRDNWLSVGKLQFDYLLRHDLQPAARVLDLGCGNLRLGWRLISYLQPGNYFGVDISPVILLAALERIKEFDLQDRLPRLFLAGGTDLGFLPESFFDFVQAHSVFTHLRLEAIEQVLAGVWRVMKPGTRFDFTYCSTEGGPRDILGEDFRYPGALLLQAAERHGFSATPMEDWSYGQAKIRAVKPGIVFRSDR
jgi:ubiquinone/menaquinone biosynthesis C-methylase UbiE